MSESADKPPQKSSGTSPFVVVMTIIGAVLGFMVVGPLCWVLFTAWWGEDSWLSKMQWWGWALIMSFVTAAMMGGQAEEHVKKDRLKKAQQRFYERYGDQEPPSC